ncbi:T9SS type A sorting domain-containing protein [Hyunsoonleella ulvae]|uniref:T9SS type A sorting domain-containing protein n=1 Tax=Hyunsoonleella ulvae TaxID=2799948 RepID=UPI001939CD3A|nr:T9SS type A sorting domain-containing protein [Hyunsoonleella ulvae]
MKNNYILSFAVAMLISVQAFAQVDVTIRVDMAGQSVSANGVHVVGTINGWTPDATMLTQEGATSIYAVTIQLNQGWHRYKFLNGNAWGTEEQAGYPCAPSNGDRFLYINNSGAAVVLEPVPFNGCNASGTSFEVTLNVDMSSEGTIAPGNVHVAGWLTDWNAEVLSLPNVSGDIHSGILRLPTPSDYPIELEYKYLSASGWGNDETPGPEATCATVTGTNRLVTVNSSGEHLLDVFNACNYSTLSTEVFDANALNLLYSQSDRTVKILNDGFIDSASQIQVFDVTGKSIKTLNHNTVIDFQNHTNGLYFVRITSGDKQAVKKVMVY